VPKQLTGCYVWPLGLVGANLVWPLPKTSSKGDCSYIATPQLGEPEGMHEVGLVWTTPDTQNPAPGPAPPPPIFGGGEFQDYAATRGWNLGMRQPSVRDHAATQRPRSREMRPPCLELCHHPQTSLGDRQPSERAHCDPWNKVQGNAVTWTGIMPKPTDQTVLGRGATSTEITHRPEGTSPRIVRPPEQEVHCHPRRSRNAATCSQNHAQYGP